MILEETKLKQLLIWVQQPQNKSTTPEKEEMNYWQLQAKIAR